MLSEIDRKEIIDIIKLTVNGKIDRLHTKVDNHHIEMEAFITRLDPVIDAMGWLSTTRRAVTWIGGIAGSLAAVFTLNNIFQK